MQVSAYTAWTEQFIASFEQKLQTMTTKEQDQYFQLIATILSAPKVTSSSNTDIKLLVKELNQRL